MLAQDDAPTPPMRCLTEPFPARNQANQGWDEGTSASQARYYEKSPQILKVEQMKHCPTHLWQDCRHIVEWYLIYTQRDYGTDGRVEGIRT